MQIIRALLFDFGGTLDGNGLHWRERVYRSIQRNFPHVSRHEFDSADRTAVEKFVASGSGLQSSLRESADAIFARIDETLELDSQVKDLFLDRFCQDAADSLRQNRQWLKTLRAHYQLGVIITLQKYNSMDRIFKMS